MARRRVLADRNLAAHAPAPTQGRVRQSRRNGAGRKLRRRAQPQPVEVGQVKRARANASDIAAPFGASLCDMAQGVGALVAEIGGIGGAADAEAIEQTENGAGHHWPP